MGKIKKILVVEDDTALCASIVESLKGADFAPIGVNDPRDCLVNLKKYKFDCMILDMRLNGENGEEIIKFLRASKENKNSQVPILVISGVLSKPLLEMIAEDIQGALVKPFDLHSLLGAVNKILE